MYPVLLLGILYFISPVRSNAVALGNLAVVITNHDLISTDDEPLKAKSADLWCQSKIDSDPPATLEWARFFRTTDRKYLEATLSENKTKARLVLGENTPITHAGKYRCEMRTVSGDMIYGNMFVYTRPVIHTNGSRKFHKSEHDPVLVEGEEVSFPLESEARIECPVTGFPTPNVVWYKDGLPLESEGRFNIIQNAVIIEKFSDEDAGKYRCVATNQYSAAVDATEQEFELKLDQIVSVSGNYGWVLPLVVILIILLLVFIIIYLYQVCNKYNSANYNVARREQNMRREQEEEQRRLTKETP